MYRVAFLERIEKVDWIHLKMQLLVLDHAKGSIEAEHPNQQDTD